jgi:hypothetical protein
MIMIILLGWETLEVKGMVHDVDIENCLEMKPLCPWLGVALKYCSRSTK